MTLSYVAYFSFQVLDIGTIGHRKRLLASLGEKQVPEMTVSTVSS